VGGDIDRLLLLLDPEVAGDVDLGPGAAAQLPLRGAEAVSQSLLGFFGPEAGATLVSQPVNGRPGALAFRSGQLAAILVFKLRGERIYDVHAIGDPAKLAFVSRQLSLRG
jgi:RNA polymerase sigma-70 factor (ECF subfamily)